MKLKLIDVEDHGEEVTFGTCDLCMSEGWADNPVFIFEKEDGTRFDVDGYVWDWGDYFELYVDNVINFAAFVASKDFKPDFDQEINAKGWNNWDGYGWLRDLLYDYAKSNFCKDKEYDPW